MKMATSFFVITVSCLRDRRIQTLIIRSHSIEIAFYIDKKGRRVHEDWMITWEGNPVAFAYRFPYIIAFEPTFVEVRHMDTVCIYIYIHRNMGTRSN